MSIDIMMPYYGDPRLLREAVLSVVAQTSGDWHLTIIDDDYPDETTGAWVRSLADERLHYVRNKKNLGVAGNFQRAVDLATQDYVVIMGCDDLLEAGYVARMSSLIEAFPGAAYIQPGVTVIDEHGRPSLPISDRLKHWLRPRVSRPSVFSGESLTTSLLNGNWTYFPSICWRRAELVAHGFRPEYDVVLDLALQLSILAGGGALVLDPEITFRYRRHAASVSAWKATDGTRFHEEGALFKETLERAVDLDWKRAERAARLHWTSRLNALTRLPAALSHRDGQGIATLLVHAFGR